MNIFMLDSAVTSCAEYHCDKHVVKMMVEYAQLLSTAHRVVDDLPDDNADFYKVAHKNHPSAVWVRESLYNYTWLHFLWVELSKEYTKRYAKEHTSYTKLKDVLSTPPKNIPVVAMTPLPQCMPDEYKNESPVVAYRDYYYGEKKDFATWKTRMPEWFNQRRNKEIDRGIVKTIRHGE
tara:strand:+ start:1021 stop:1554 length:534 start_codon:yes stop_codon:yes gene_type:complete